MCARIAQQQTWHGENCIRLRVTGHAASIQRKNAVFPKLDTSTLRPAVEASLFRGIAYALDPVEKRGGIPAQGRALLYGSTLRIIFIGGSRKLRGSLLAEHF